MSLDFLRDNTNIINGRGAVKREKPIDFTARTTEGFKNNLSVVNQYGLKPKVKAKQIVKLYANNEKEIVDLVTRTLIAKPELTREICRGLRRGLSAMQKEISSQGYIVDMVKAYNMSKRGNNLLGTLFAFISKGLIVVDDRQSQLVKAHGRGTGGLKIRLVSKREALKPNYKAVGRFIGVKANQAMISRFRISSINELGKYLGIENNAYRVLANRFSVNEYFGKNDLNTETSFKLANLTDEEVADCVECGAFTKEEVKAQLHPKRIKSVSRILQKRVAF